MTPPQRVEKPCHCEPVRTLAWQSPRFENIFFLKLRVLLLLRRSPHQSEDWFAMTFNFETFFDSLRRGHDPALRYYNNKEYKYEDPDRE